MKPSRSALHLLVVAALVLGACLAAACRARRVGAGEAGRQDEALRQELVSELADHIHDERVLAAMGRVPRHLFVPDAPLPEAYANTPLPIEHGQTISQPQIVAKMTEALSLRGPERVLEIGTGSGYQAAVLSVLARRVYSIEIVPELGETARKRLAALGYANVQVLIGDGYRGWPQEAPFDRIIITAAPPEVPAALFDQLAVGGILVAPVGKSALLGQRLLRYTKTAEGMTVEELALVSFVPMVPGDAGRP